MPTSPPGPRDLPCRSRCPGSRRPPIPGLLLWLLSIGGCGPVPDGSVAGPGPWNVVLIMVDTLRADHLSLYGYERPTSPELDRHARRGIVFENAWSQAACTFPSVNSLLTSTWPQTFVERAAERGLGIPEGTASLPTVLRDRGYATAAASASSIVRVSPSRHNPEGGFGTGFDRFEESCLAYPASCLNEQASELLDALDEPFLLYLHYLDPHEPYRPPASHPRRFAAAEHPKPWIANGRLQPLKRMLYDDGPAVELEEGDVAHAIDLYDEEILYLDGRLGELLDELERRRLLDRTVIALVSDHGEELLDHGHLFHCRNLVYDTVTRVPLVLWIPGVGGARVESPALNLDVVPTILDYLDLGPETHGFEGRSLRPAIEEGRRVNRFALASQGVGRSVSDGRFQLILDVRTGEKVLYDLSAEVGQRVDRLALDPDRAATLEEILRRWIDAAEGRPEERLEAAEETTERLKALGYL